MKKLALLLGLILLVSVSAPAAADTDTAKAAVQSLLTDLYGYTEAEARTFTVQVSDDADAWYATFSKRPDWAYTAAIRKDNRSFIKTQSPFTTGYASGASEASLRCTLRAIDKNDWFALWNPESRAALTSAIEACGDIQMTTALQGGLASDEYTPAQALDDLFLSCFGEEALWSDAVAAWRDTAFEGFGLIREGTTFSVPQGIHTRWGTLKNMREQVSICEFAGAVPDALADAFADPNLQGWQCLAGAYRTGEPLTEDETYRGEGLAAFDNGEERLLVLLLQDAATQAWQVQPISKTALLPDRDVYITFNSSTDRFFIRYPVSDTEEESFQCRLMQYSVTDSLNTVVCALMEYRDTDLANRTTLCIDSGGGIDYSGWYQVTVTKDGVEEQTQYPALAPDILEYIDVSAFPRTVEACEAAALEADAVPDGYAISGSVHLRAKTSSHSEDLGMYLRGTLVEVLDTQAGSTFPWYHVRIGNTEGYMSSNYVDYYENCKSIAACMTPCMARLTGGTALKKQAGMFSQTVTQLPAGSIVRVLAECGGWLHVSIPESTDEWMMQQGETCGYIKSNAVHMAVTALQLDWQ